MTGPFDSGAGKRSRLEDALVFQIDERDIELLQVEETKERNFAERFADERVDVWRSDSADTDSAPDVFARINELQSVLAILRACLPDAKNLASMEQQLLRAAEQAATTAMAGETLGEYDPAVQAIAAEIASVEDALLEAEKKVPLSWLRHRLDEHDFGDMALAHYLRFHIQHLTIAPRSINRVDLLVSRLVSRRDHLGILRLRPASEIADLLRACVPQSDTPPHVRNTAIQFFRKAGERLDEIEHGDDLFDSGFYVDVLGYKLSLRTDYFDPRLLYTAAELEIAIENWLVHTQGMNLRALDPQFAEAREKVRRIFSNNPGNARTLTEQWNRDFSNPDMRVPRASTAPGDAASARRTETARGPLPWRKLVAAGVLLIGIIYVAPMVMDLFRTNQRGLKTVPASELSTISPLLAKGSWAGDLPGRIFIGYVDPDRWRSSSNADRQQIAQDIRDQLRYRQVAGALVYMSLGADETLVLNIMEGQIRYVQPRIE